MKKKLYAGLAAILFVAGAAGTASSATIGMFTDGSVNNAPANMDYYVSQNPANSWSAITDAAFATMNTATLLANYDIMIMPWYVNSGNNMSWNDVIRPYLEGGGRVLWEDPHNTDDLSGSGITFGYPPAGYNDDISLVAPFDSNGAEGYYHIHYGISSVNSDWDVWSTDSGGGIHGIYGEFGSNGGRMLLGISDNLFHPEMWQAYDADHFALLKNQLNWLGSGDVDTDLGGDPVPEPATMLLFGTGIAGLIGSRARRKK